MSLWESANIAGWKKESRNICHRVDSSGTKPSIRHRIVRRRDGNYLLLRSRSWDKKKEWKSIKDFEKHRWMEPPSWSEAKRLIDGRKKQDPKLGCEQERTSALSRFKGWTRMGLGESFHLDLWNPISDDSFTLVKKVSSYDMLTDFYTTEKSSIFMERFKEYWPRLSFFLSS